MLAWARKPALTIVLSCNSHPNTLQTVQTCIPATHIHTQSI